MTTHELKTIPPFFDDVNTGKKSFEIRYNDRDYKVGDILHLREYWLGGYTGREVEIKVAYILYGPVFGLMDGWCIMAVVR